MKRRETASRLVVALVVALGMAAVPGAADFPVAGATATLAAAQAQDPTRSQIIDHVSPARDSQGKAPKLFSWTAVRGADSYSIGVWTEVDQLLWRQNNIPTTSVERPEDVKLEPGTYFWSVSALRDGQQIAESGLSAFVVRE